MVESHVSNQLCSHIDPKYCYMMRDLLLLDVAKILVVLLYSCTLD